jgi:hypothetical protein
MFVFCKQNIGIIFLAGMVKDHRSLGHHLSSFRCMSCLTIHSYAVAIQICAHFDLQ